MVRQAREFFLIAVGEDIEPSDELLAREAHRMAMETQMVLRTVWTRLFGPVDLEVKEFERLRSARFEAH